MITVLHGGGGVYQLVAVLHKGGPENYYSVPQNLGYYIRHIVSIDNQISFLLDKN